jgi:hypothetical protein
VPGTLVTDATTAGGGPPASVTFFFDHDVLSDGSAEPELRCDGNSPVFSGQAAPDAVICLYNQVITAASVWSISAPLVHVAAVPPVAVPQSGMVRIFP